MEAVAVEHRLDVHLSHEPVLTVVGAVEWNAKPPAYETMRTVATHHPFGEPRPLTLIAGRHEGQLASAS